MATSGTVGQTVIDVQEMIDTAMRRVGVPAAQGTPETNQVGKNILFSYLSDLGNKGVPTWRIQQHVIGLVPAQRSYALPVGTIELLSVNYQTVTRPEGDPFTSAGGTASNAFDGDLSTACTQTSADGNIGLLYDQELAITLVGIMSRVTRDYDLVFEWSDDDVTWEEIYAPGSASYANRQWVYYQIENPREALYFRVRETGGAILDLREVMFAFNTNEVPLGEFNVNDYASMNSKSFQSRQVNQYYLQRDRIQPKVIAYPVPNYAFDQLVCWLHRQIEDVGDLTNELDIPQRWTEAAQWNLTARMGVELQFLGIPVDATKLQLAMSMATSSENIAWGREGGTAVSQMAPDISPYTR